MVPNASPHDNRALPRLRPLVQALLVVVAVAAVGGTVLGICSCAPTRSAVAAHPDPRARPAQAAQPAWWPTPADPNDPRTWAERYAQAQGASRAVNLRRSEALANLHRLRQRIDRETEPGTAAHRAQVARFRRRVVAPLLAALPRGDGDLIPTLCRIAPADPRVVLLTAELTGYLTRPLPKRFGQIYSLVSLLATALPLLARAATVPPERLRVLAVAEKILSVLCPPGKPGPSIKGNTYRLKQSLRKAAKILAQGPTASRSQHILQSLKSCP